jgi:hypothetical protein
MPRAAPALATMTLSVSICRTSRPRVAPSEARTASSRARSAARANCMFITLTHAMSSTPTQNPSIVSSAPRRPSGVYTRMSGSTRPAVKRLFVSGYAAAKRRAMEVTSAFARSSEVPGASSASTIGERSRGSLRGRAGNCAWSGIQTSSR